jgi:hypothetical protein
MHVSRDPAGQETLRSALAREGELTREVIRLNCELVKTDLRAMEARLTLRVCVMWTIFMIAAGILIGTR